MLLALGPAALVMVQPDLGSASVYVVTALVMLFVAGTPGRHIAGLVALFATALVLVLAVAPAVGVDVLKPYQVDRLTGFLNPSRTTARRPTSSTSRRSRSAPARRPAGGWSRSTQTGLNFLPEHHTDFVFSVVGETLGLRRRRARAVAVRAC